MRFIFLLISIYIPFYTLTVLYLRNILHLPNALAVARDAFICILFGLALKFIAKRRSIQLALLFLGIFVFFEVILIALQGRWEPGFYFLRVYLLPVLYGILLYVYVYSYPVKTFIHWLYVINVLVIIAAPILYYVTFKDTNFILDITGRDTLANSWRIASANLIRMGLPFSSPNTLGMYLSANIFFFYIVKMKKMYDPGKINFLFFCNFTMLILSFSRSSFLALLVSFLILAIALYKQFLSKVITISLLVGIGGSLLMVYINYLSDGVLMKWVELNITLSDPSIGGHSGTVSDAFLNLDQYIWTGYPRGTVGGKAAVFTDNIINVENSILILFYSFGAIALFLIFVYAFFMGGFLSNKYQLALLCGASVSIIALPNILEVELMMHLLFLYFILGIMTEEESINLKQNFRIAKDPVPDH